MKALHVALLALLCIVAGCTSEATSPREDALISEICGELPQGWTCTIEQENAKKGHPHGLEEPLFRTDFTNPHQAFESPFAGGRKKLNPIIQLYFYDIASKAHVMEVIEKERIHSWDIPIYFGETEKYIVVTSPSYVNYGVFSEDAKKAIRPMWEALRKRIDNKEDKNVDELAEPGK